MDTDFDGFSDDVNVAPAKRTTNLPSVAINGCVEVSGSIANKSQSSTSAELGSSTPRIETLSEKGLVEYPENENSRVAPASFHARSRANANCSSLRSATMLMSTPRQDRIQ